MPKVSVIVPIYNTEKYLRQCLDSIINQTLKDIEIICVNDGSTDNSLNILNEYVKKDGRIKIIDLKKNGGLGNARNVALPHVTSEYVMFLDSDDWYELNACEMAYNQIIKNNNDLVFFDTYIYKEETNEKYTNDKRIGKFRKYINQPQVRFSDIDEPFMSFCECWFKIYKTSFLKDNNLYFEVGYAYEDVNFYFNLILCNPVFSVIDTPLIVYRKRKGAITENSSYWRDLLYVREKMYYKMLESKNEKYIDYYVISYIGSLTSHYKKFLKSDLFFELKYYNKIRKIFIKLNKNHNIMGFKDYIDYKYFIDTTKTDCFLYFLKIFIKNIFSISNSPDRKRKIITIMGMKMKIHKKN